MLGDVIRIKNREEGIWNYRHKRIFLRSDGRKGIRNVVAVAYLMEYAHHVAKEIADPFREDAHVIGFPSCFPNAYSQKVIGRLCAHPNVGAVLLVSLGCESFNRCRQEDGCPVEALVIQHEGGTKSAILIKLGDILPRDGEVRFRFPNVSDNAEIVEMMASGVHLILFITGRGSVVGSALAPVIKIATNPKMYECCMKI